MEIPPTTSLLDTSNTLTAVLLDLARIQHRSVIFFDQLDSRKEFTPAHTLFTPNCAVVCWYALSHKSSTYCLTFMKA